MGTKNNTQLQEVSSANGYLYLNNSGLSLLK